MKKIVFLPFIALLGAFTSCNSSKSTDYDSFRSHIDLYNLTAWQNNLVLDPFNVAYRLDIYLAEGETAPNREKLFPGATLETKDNQIYTITYTLPTVAPEKDLMREGSLIINTYGNSLSEENSHWQITTDEENAYLVSSGTGAFWGMKIREGEYIVSNAGSSSWNVRGNELYLYVPGIYTAMVNWDVNMNIEQTTGSGTSLDKARFEITTPVNEYNTGKIFGVSTVEMFRYEIQDPLLYSAECAYLQKSGGKEELITMDKYGMITSKSDTITYDFGQKWDSCLPPFTIKGKVDDVWETHSYDPYGNLLNIEREEKESE